MLAHFSLSSTVQGSLGNSGELALAVFRVLELRMTDDPSYYFNIIMNLIGFCKKSPGKHL